MKAAVINNFGDPQVFEISNISEPVIEENEILIEVISGSVNPIDWKQRRGNHRFIFGAPFPIILGYDVAGTVVKMGTKVKDFKIGDRVCGVLNNTYGGGLAQFAKGYVKCFAKAPVNIDMTISAALPLSGLTALQALRDLGKIRKNDKVLIIGAAGGVGHFAVQISDIFGADIYAVSSGRHKGFVENLAGVHFIDYLKTDILKFSQQFHIVFDTVGKYSFPKCKHLLLPGGTYINTLPRPKIIVHKILSLFTRGKKVKTFLMKYNPKDLAQLVEWIENGNLTIFIDKEFSIYNVAQAHEYSELGHTEGKILIRYF